MSPRPILKRAGSNSDHPHRHAVHFPPSPSLTRTFFAYSPSAYDRSPIVVAPNSLALPERGCPGRTYTLDDPTSPPPSPTPRRGPSFAGIDVPSRAYAFASSRNEGAPQSDTLLPPLVPDTSSSSESDESDGFAYPNQDAYSPEPYHVHGLAIPAPKREKGSSYTPVDMSAETALSFLPYSSSSPINNSYISYPVMSDSRIDSPRRRKPSRERKHDSSNDPGRIPSGEGCSPPRRSKKRTTASFSLCNTLSSMSVDDGCLGGF